MTAPIHEFPTLGTRPICAGPEVGWVVVRSGCNVELDEPMQPLAIMTAAARNALAERGIATLDTSIAPEVPGDDSIKEFRKAAADFVSAQVAFTNAVLAARRAEISDQELAAIAGIGESESRRSRAGSEGVAEWVAPVDTSSGMRVLLWTSLGVAIGLADRLVARAPGLYLSSKTVHEEVTWMAFGGLAGFFVGLASWWLNRDEDASADAGT